MDDLISRQAAIDALDGEFNITGRENAETIRDYINGVSKKLREMPSAERRGRWTDHSDEWDGGYYECSVCGEAFTFIEGTPKENLYNYCPKCGTRMDKILT